MPEIFWNTEVFLYKIFRHCETKSSQRKIVIPFCIKYRNQWWNWCNSLNTNVKTVVVVLIIRSSKPPQLPSNISHLVNEWILSTSPKMNFNPVESESSVAGQLWNQFIWYLSIERQQAARCGMHTLVSLGDTYLELASGIDFLSWFSDSWSFGLLGGHHMNNQSVLLTAMFLAIENFHEIDGEIRFTGIFLWV